MFLFHTADATLTAADFKVVYDATYKAQGCWRPLGERLELELHELENITGKNEDCLQKVLSLWLKRRSKDPTWAKLVAALRHETVGADGAVIYDLIQKYLGKDKQHSFLLLTPSCVLSGVDRPMFTSEHAHNCQQSQK